MMTIDNIVASTNIVLISLAVWAGITWLPIAWKAFRFIRKGKMPPQIYAVGLGIVWICSAVILARYYSLAMRELGWLWLRDTIVAPAVFIYMAVGFMVFAAGYFAPRESGRRTAGDDLFAKAGAAIGCFVFVGLWIIKLVV